MATLAQTASPGLGDPDMGNGMAAPGAPMALGQAPGAGDAAAAASAVAGAGTAVAVPPPTLRTLTGLGGILEQPAVKKALGSKA